MAKKPTIEIAKNTSGLRGVRPAFRKVESIEELRRALHEQDNEVPAPPQTLSTLCAAMESAQMLDQLVALAPNLAELIVAAAQEIAPDLPTITENSQLALAEVLIAASTYHRRLEELSTYPH